MHRLTRRSLMTTFAGGAALAACGNGLNSNGATTIDARVEATVNQMYRDVPDAQALSGKAVGMQVVLEHFR